MNKHEFKNRWIVGKVSWDDIINCAKEWGINVDNLDETRFRILKEAGIEDADDYDFRNNEY